MEVPELMYELSDDDGLVALGDPGEVALKAVTEKALLVFTDEWMKTRDAYQRLAQPRPSQEQFRQALNSLAEEGKLERDPPITEDSQQGKTKFWRLRNLTFNGPPLYRWK